MTPCRITAALTVFATASLAAGASRLRNNPVSDAAAWDVAASGPLWDALLRALPDSHPTANEWATHGEALAGAITGSETPADILDASTAARIYHLYLPVYFFMRDRVRAHRAAGGRGPVAIGLSAPQGCGKTTLVDALVERFAADGLTCAVVSIDDFYLTGAAQDEVAARSSDNPLLQVRGNAGTHDLPLGVATLNALKFGAVGPTGASKLRVPRYDKAAHQGRGDRAPPDTWPMLDQPPDVILLEGWMNGFAPVPADAPVLSEHVGLAEVNERLRAYDQWHSLMDAWVVLAVEDPEWVYRWRLQAEHAMAAKGRPGMSDAQVADFVARYMPAYKAFLPALYSAARSGGVDGKPTLAAYVDAARRPVKPP
jgi:D-glycerate 3-kinase